MLTLCLALLCGAVLMCPREVRADHIEARIDSWGRVVAVVVRDDAAPVAYHSHRAEAIFFEVAPRRQTEVTVTRRRGFLPGRDVTTFRFSR